MDLAVSFIAALVFFPALGLVIWVWLSMDQVEQELQAFSELEGPHYEA